MLTGTDDTGKLPKPKEGESPKVDEPPLPETLVRIPTQQVGSIPHDSGNSDGE